MNKTFRPLLCSLLALSPMLIAARGCSFGSDDVPLGSNGEGGEGGETALGQAGEAGQLGEAGSFAQAGKAAGGTGGSGSGASAGAAGKSGSGASGGTGGTPEPIDNTGPCIEQLTPLVGSDPTQFGFTTEDVWSLIDGKHVASQYLIEGGTSPVEFYMVEAELFHVDSEPNPDFNLDIFVQCDDHIRARGTARFVSADGSFDETFPDFELNVGVPLTDGPGDPASRLAAGGVITLESSQLRGDYQPALSADQCFLAMQFNVNLSRTEFTGSFIETILNAPCGNDDPNTAVLGRDAGAWGCSAGADCTSTEPHVAVVVEADSCDAIGTQLTQAGDDESFSLAGTTLRREEIWYAGCAPQLPEYVLAYSPSSPVELRLCHNDTVTACVLLPGVAGELSYDLSTAFSAAGTTEFRFVD
jgi:hypothetical protein